MLLILGKLFVTISSRFKKIILTLRFEWTGQAAKDLPEIQNKFVDKEII